MPSILFSQFSNLTDGDHDGYGSYRADDKDRAFLNSRSLVTSFPGWFTPLAIIHKLLGSLTWSTDVGAA